MGKIDLYALGTGEMWFALGRFQKLNGRNWRAKLRGHWERGCVDVDARYRAGLMLARNILGNVLLAKVR